MRLRVADFLPDPWRSPMGRTTVLVSVHSAGCEGCRKYLEELGPSAAEFEVWDARLAVITPEPDGAATPVAPAGEAAVIVADRYGHVYEATYAGEGHAFPAPRQLEEWLKFLGTLCPE
jgi:hypothetical protein